MYFMRGGSRLSLAAVLFEDGFEGGSCLSRGVVRDVVAEVAVVGHGYPPKLVSADVAWIVLC